MYKMTAEKARAAAQSKPSQAKLVKALVATVYHLVHQLLSAKQSIARRNLAVAAAEAEAAFWRDRCLTLTRERMAETFDAKTAFSSEIELGGRRVMLHG